MTYDGSEVLNYIDGQLDAAYAQSGLMTADTDWLGIGTNGAANDSPFQGMIDDLRLYHRVLTADEIDHLARQGSSAVSWGYKVQWLR